MTDWTFEGAWPYEPRYFATEDGRMHYIDEGSAESQPVVLLHGNPTWSFLYRRCISRLLGDGRRVIAVDHLGFGRSDVPGDPELYTIGAHAARLAAFLDSLRLRRPVVAVHDWAGPIAMPWIGTRDVAGLVILNTFAPTLPGPIGSRSSLSALRGRISGPFLVKRRNVPVEQFLFKAGTADPGRWTDQTKAAYRAPHPTPASRVPMLVFPREIPFEAGHPVARMTREAAPRIARAFNARPVQIIWGMKDVLFGTKVLEQWQQLLPNAGVLRLDAAGHFLHEDAPELVAETIASFTNNVAEGWAPPGPRPK